MSERRTTRQSFSARKHIRDSSDAEVCLGRNRGAKTAMTLALRSPSMVRDVVAVDNAPVDAILSTDFAKYVRGMKKVEDAGVSSQREADAIMAEFEEVCLVPSCHLTSLLSTHIYIYIYIHGVAATRGPRP